MKWMERVVLFVLLLCLAFPVPERSFASEKAGDLEEETSGWNFSDGDWHWRDPDGALALGWREIGGEWYYFLEDGSMNRGPLFFGNGVYEFSESGALRRARRQENTGGGPYPAPCYDAETQVLFDQMNEKKRELYFEEFPNREDGLDTDLPVYDRYACFEMDMELNKAASHRLEAIEGRGYIGREVPGEGTLEDYLAQIPYRENATCLEIYIKNCRDADEAFEELIRQTEDRYEVRRDRTRSLEYYRTMGMAHREEGGKHEFLIILMR